MSGSDEFEDPYPHLAAARRRGAVTTVWPLPPAAGAPEVGPVYSVLAYDKCVRVLRDHETYSSRALSEVMGPLFAGAIIAMDEPEHRLHRALVAPAFRPKVLEQWQMTVVRPAIDGVIDSFIDQDRVDLVEDLTFAFPVRVIAEILGLPQRDVASFQRWSLDLINMFDDVERGMRALEEFRSYFMEFISERRLAPRDDLVSDLIRSEVDGYRLDDDAIFASIKMLLPAGVETTYRSLGNLLVGLLTHRPQLDALTHDRALIGPRSRKACGGRRRSSWSRGKPRATPTSPVCTSPPNSTCSSSWRLRITTSAATSTRKDSISRERPHHTSRSGLGPTCAWECTSPASNPTLRSNASSTAYPTSDSMSTGPLPEYWGRCSARLTH